MRLCRIVVALAVAVTGLAGGIQAKDKDQPAPKRRAATVLYKVSPGASDEQRAALDEVLAKFALRTDKELVGGQVKRAKAQAAKLPDEEEICAVICATGAVEFAEPDYLVPPVATPNDPSYPNQWHHAKINSPGAWDIAVGNSSVIVGICDTGADSDHPDLAANLMLPGFNSVDNTANTEDINGHGTMTAGTVGAVGNNSIGVAGVAWNIKLLPVKVSNASNGWAYYSDMVEGIRWAADRGAKVVNLSYLAGGSSTIDSAAQYLRNKGGLLFVAAGNDGKDISSSYPDFASFVLVGATDSADNRASWSNYGTAIDVVAPGVGIWTTVLGGGYGAPSGTSFASPCAAGVAALIYSVQPTFTPSQVEGFIFSTCKDLGAAGDDNVFGKGRVDSARAVAAARDAASNVAPVAVARANPTTGQAPLAVSFSGSESYDPDGTIVGYAWDFGDGAVGSGVTANHTYLNPGAYTATLTVTDDKGATSRSSVTVTVNPDPNMVIYVSDIAMSLSPARSGTTALARVSVVNLAGEPMPGATVTGTWSGVVKGTVSGVTGPDGSVVLSSNKTKKTGTFTFTVTGVALTGYTYDPALNAETSDSIRN